MNSIDDGLEGNGSKANAIVARIVLGDQFIGVAAESGLDSAIEAEADRYDFENTAGAMPVAGCHVCRSIRTSA